MMEQATGVNLWLRKALVCLFTAALCWLVVTRSLPAYLARVAPETALMINANQPDALLRLAEVKLATDQARVEKAKLETPAGTNLATATTAAKPDTKIDDDVRALVQRASKIDPLNAQVPHLLADLAERAGDRSLAIKQLETTLQHSLHDGAAIYKLILFSIDARDYVKATAYTELLLRINPESFQVVLPVLLYLANTEAATEALTAMFARSTYGRTWFFIELPAKAADLRIPQTLLLGLQNTANPPTSRELSPYLQFLLDRHQLYGLAYYTWLQFTPPEHFDNDNLVFNGGFQRPTTAMPFDWMIEAGAGVTAQIVSKPYEDGHHGLNLEFGSGRVEFGGVQQALLLAPGTYDFSTQYKGSLIGRRGLVWRLTCTKPTTQILETPVQVGLQPSWKDISQTFTVPEAGCLGQRLALVHTARSASEQILSGSVWYKHIKIKRRPDAPATQKVQ
jgi:tetratricopeptide (TPR) repeat protein